MGPTRREQADGRTDGLSSGRGLGGADGAREVRTGGRAVERTGGRVDGRTGRSGAEQARSGRLADEADEADERTPFHSWAPSPLVSSECECTGCLGVQWGPGGFPFKHPYLAHGLV